MKALSIKQPWAWLICSGLKDIENRTWPVGRRPQHGPYQSQCANFRIELPAHIYVHAGLKVEQSAIPIRDRRLFGGPEHGALISREETKRMENEALWPDGKIWKLSAIIGEVTITACVTESHSPWFEGPYGFVLKDPVLYDKLIPYKGQLGFFEVKLAEVK